MTIKKYIFAFKLLGTLILTGFLISNCRAEMAGKKWSVDLYGHSLKFDYPADLFKGYEQVSINEQTIQELTLINWNNPASDTLISQMKAYREQLGMDDLANLLMLNKTTAVIFKCYNESFRNIFKYTILKKQGFDVILGYDPASSTLYGRTNFNVENCLFIEKNNKRYYDLSFNQKRRPEEEKAYNEAFPLNGNACSKLHPLVMNLINPPHFGVSTRKKVIPFEYDGFVYFFNCNVNMSLVSYYRDLPPINISNVYLNYGLSESAERSLVKEIREAVSAMSKTEAVNFILRFTQSAVEYKKDELVYGEEKFSFPEETLCNTYADCEDKAMLFANLVYQVLGIKSVGLYYKDAKHINIALESWKNDLKPSFTFNDHNYIICEPSGSGFNAGENANAYIHASLIDW